MTKNKKVERKKLLTLSDLYNFYAHKKENFTFSSAETGYKLSVQVPAQFEINKEQNDNSLLFCLVKLMHSGENRNHSSVTNEALIKASKGLAYKPILANFVEYTDPETNETMVDFTSHDMELTENGVIYYEHQIGCFTADKPYFEVEEDTGHNFLYGYCAIPREYTKACSVIERKNGTKISVELEINEMQYSVKDQVLELTDVTIMGATCLGKDPDTLKNVEEGMKNARLDILDFSVENNSIINYSNTQNNKLIETLEKLNSTLSRFNINTSNKEGGKTLVKFEELLKKYNKTIEEITFEYENLTDEELEQKFEEVFGENTEGEGADPEPTSEGDEENNENEDVNAENEEEGKSGNDESQKDEGTEEPKDSEDKEDIVNEPIAFSVGNKTFAVSLDDMQFAMNALINETYSEQDGCYYSTIVYEDHVVMVDCFSYGKAYRQKYAKRKKRCSLIGERVPVKSYWVTEEEESMIDNMRANYSTIEEQLKEYQLKEENAQKDALFVSEDYSSISNKEEFKALAENHAEFSVDELKAKLDEVLLSYAKRNALEFSVKTPEKKKVNRVSFGMTTEESNTGNEFKPYGDLFD